MQKEGGFYKKTALYVGIGENIMALEDRIIQLCNYLGRSQQKKYNFVILLID